MKKLTLITVIALLIACTPEMVSKLEKALKDSQQTHLLVIGDSQSSGGISEPYKATKIPDSTLFDWQKDKFITGEYGKGFYPLMAMETYGKLYIANEAIGGSGIVNNWGSVKNGNYEIMKRRADIYIEQNQKFDIIFLAVGGWDALRDHPIPQIRRELCWLIDKLQEDFPNTKILLSKAPGGDNYSERMKAVRSIQDSIIQANELIFEAYDIGQLVDKYGVNEISTDGIHLKQKFSDTVGEYNGRIINELLYAED